MHLALSYTVVLASFVMFVTNPRAAEGVFPRDLPALTKGAPRFSSYTGKSRVLVFWAVWCGPCAAELRELERVSRLENIPFVGIAVDSPEKPAQRMVQLTGVTFANYRDNSSELADAYGISGVPALLLLDVTGRVVWSQSGYANFPEQDLREQIRKLQK